MVDLDERSDSRLEPNLGLIRASEWASAPAALQTQVSPNARRTVRQDLRAAGLGVLAQLAIGALIALVALAFAENLHSEHKTRSHSDLKPMLEPGQVIAAWSPDAGTTAL